MYAPQKWNDVIRCRPGKDGFFIKTSQLYHICLARCPSPKYLSLAPVIIQESPIHQCSFLSHRWWVSNRADVERVQMKDIITFTLLVILPLVLFISTFWWY